MSALHRAFIAADAESSKITRLAALAYEARLLIGEALAIIFPRDA